MLCTKRRFPIFNYFILLIFIASFGITGINLSAEESYPYSQALAIIREKALFYKPSVIKKNNKNLKAVLSSLDRYSDYLTPKEYSEFLKSQKSYYTGLGMEIEKDAQGRIICMPYPGSPADLAGIGFGDILVAVNGKKTEKKSIFSISSMTRGPEGTSVILTIKDEKGRQKQLRIERKKIRARSVGFQKTDNICIIKISVFTLGTGRDLKFALTDMAENCPVVIDLRGNPGGDLNSAIDCAMLFLDKGSNIIKIEKRYETKIYKSTGNKVEISSPVYIFQDRHTASAAEVFIAALTQNKKAVSIGEKTYGKGVVQDIFELGDGSAIFLTTGYLIPPNGIKYHKKGLVPDYKAKNSEACSDIVKALIKGEPVSALPEPEKKKNKKKAKKPGKKSGAMFFACFDRNFNFNKDALEWSFHLKKSYEIIRETYIFQRKISHGISYIVCVGPGKTRSRIEKKRKALTQKVGIPMFIKYVEKDLRPEKKITIKKSISSKKKLQKSDKSWHIQAGSYLSFESALAEVKRLKRSIRMLPVWLEIAASDLNRDRANKAKLDFETHGFKARLNIEQKESHDIFYRIFIGPYSVKNDLLIETIKKDSIISEDAFWIEK